jgi:riboflavin kinase/FMN adenylyltransferase
VRAALAAGDPGLAARLLGRAYRISARVRTGARLGRTLGIPTANLRIARKPAPRFGVYAVEAVLDDGRALPAAANLGVRPTVDGRDCLLEVHLLDYDGDLYGRRLGVRFRHFLRPETRFDNTEALRAQMLVDIERVRSLI